METKNVEVKVSELVKLAETAKLSEVIARVNEIVGLLSAKRDRGPESTRTMTEEDAKAVILGDQSALSHGKAAEALGLSYGQVYSARKGFTFKAIYKEGVKAGKIKA